MCQTQNNNEDITFSRDFSKKVMGKIWEHHIRRERIAWRLVFMFTITNLAVLISSIFSASSQEIAVYVYNAFKDFHISLGGIGFFLDNVLASNSIAIISIVNFSVLMAVLVYLTFSRRRRII